MITDVAQLINLTNATRNQFIGAGAEMTFSKVSMELFNSAFQNAPDDGRGPKCEFDVALGDVGNGQVVGLYATDTHNKKNYTEKGYSRWNHATTNVEWDIREDKINSSGPERLYSVMEMDVKNMYREFGDLIQPLLLGTPSSAADKLGCFGLSSWLTLGTALQTGGFNGYVAAYNDGTGAATFNPGEIACSASVNPRWASYYADHQGKLGDNLIALLDRAALKTHFIPSRLPSVVGKETDFGNLRFYSNDEVILNWKALSRKNGDDVNGNFGNFQTFTTYMGAPMMYVEELNTASAYLWGTNPIFGVNWDYFKVKCLNGFKFKLGQAYQKDNSHTVMVLPLDLSWSTFCTNRQLAGFLISQHA